jgi:hypothetical protein
MRTIQSQATVTSSHEMIVQVPTDIPAGKYQIVMVMDTQSDKKPRASVQFPVDDYGPWPEGLSLRREDMYGDFGR